MPTTWKLDRDSKEWVGPLTVTANGEAATYEVAVVQYKTRPAAPDWTAPDLLSGGKGVLVGPGTARILEPGLHAIWVRVTDVPEVPVLGPDSFAPPGFVRII